MVGVVAVSEGSVGVGVESGGGTVAVRLNRSRRCSRSCCIFCVLLMLAEGVRKAHVGGCGVVGVVVVGEGSGVV